MQNYRVRHLEIYSCGQKLIELIRWGRQKSVHLLTLIWFSVTSLGVPLDLFAFSGTHRPEQKSTKSTPFSESDGKLLCANQTLNSETGFQIFSEQCGCDRPGQGCCCQKKRMLRDRETGCCASKKSISHSDRQSPENISWVKSICGCGSHSSSLLIINAEPRLAHSESVVSTVDSLCESISFESVCLSMQIDPPDTPPPEFHIV